MSVPFDNMSDHQRVHLIMAFHDDDEDDDSDLVGPTGLSRHESLELLGLATEEILALLHTSGSEPEETTRNWRRRRRRSKQASMSSKHQWFGLNHQTKGSTTCWVSGLDHR